MQLKLTVGCLILLTLFTFSACGRATQMSVSNREILEALQTAVSSKKSEWLENVAKRAAERFDKKEMSTAEFNAINVIVGKARTGDWKGAQKDSFALSEGQRATSEDIARLKDLQRTQEPAKK